MSARLPWIERRWNFDFPFELYPDIVERLRGTPARLQEMTWGLPVATLTRHDKEGAWSIQENIGHLTDTHVLWDNRLEQFLDGAESLQAADMSNRRTHDSAHNEKALAALLEEFRSTRDNFVDRLNTLGDADFARTAHHPRLDAPMRLVDMCLFVADHDDYHLTRIRELIRFAGP
jgi:uncharacterized damage-inducible protein DinB